jgi:hypothetical protein
LAALSDSIANGIPSLARASIITVTWMASFLHLVKDENLQIMACSILMPQLLESLDYNKDIVERVLASYSMLSLLKSSGVKSVTLSQTIFSFTLVNFSSLFIFIFYFLFFIFYFLFFTTERVSMMSSWDKELLGKLQNLSLVTWTANELVSILTSSSWRPQ